MRCTAPRSSIRRTPADSRLSPSTTRHFDCMDLQGASVMILGGSGLVGQAVARRLLDFHPRHIALVALEERETQETATALAPLAGDTVIAIEAGDIYAPVSIAGTERGKGPGDPAHPRLLVGDTLRHLTREGLARHPPGHPPVKD